MIRPPVVGRGSGKGRGGRDPRKLVYVRSALPHREAHVNEADSERSARLGSERLLARTPLLLVALAAVVRTVTAWQTAVIFNDGPYFVRVAGLFREGDWGAALGHDLHPLYPLVVSAAAPLFGDFATAAVVVSVAAGSLAVLPLYAFLAHAFDARVARVGGLLFVLHPYASRFSSDVQSEGLYLLLFLCAVAATWRGWTEGGLPRAALGGACAGAAYLVRPEGLGIVAAGLAFGALALYRGRLPVSSFLRIAAASGFALAVVAGPYLVYLHDATGEWRLTRKKSVRQLVAPDAEARPDPSRGDSDRDRFRVPPLRRSLRKAGPPPIREARLLPARLDLEPRSLAAAWELVRVSVSALHPLLAFCVLLGAISLRAPPGRRGGFVLLVLGVYGVVLLGLAVNVGYLDRRHVIAPLLLLLGYAALGVPVFGRACARLLRPRADVRDGRAPPVLALLALAIALLVKTWAPHRDERLATRRAAEWLAGSRDLVGPVAAEKHRTAWYAGEAFVHLARGGSEGDPARLRSAGARFLIVDDDAQSELPALERALPGLRVLHRVEASERTAWVYDLAPSGPPRESGDR